jgi:hypothetical protein
MTTIKKTVTFKESIKSEPRKKSPLSLCEDLVTEEEDEEPSVKDIKVDYKNPSFL